MAIGDNFPAGISQGATKLSFWVCADHGTDAEFFLGGIKDKDPRLGYFDTLPKISTGVMAVSSTWQRHEIDLTGHDLSSVIGGFGVATSREQGARSSWLLLDDVEINLPALDEPRFVQSYVPDDCTAGGFLALLRSMIRPLCFWLFSLEDNPMISDVPILLHRHYWRHSAGIEPSRMATSATPTRAEN